MTRLQSQLASLVIQGAQGRQGFVGAQGVQGATGAQGVLGAQGVQGVTGAQGAQGTVGAQGDIGAQGVQGTIGAQGAQGVQGATGSPGAQGVQGATGPQGVQGATGSPGAQGVQGTVGAQGVQGATGPVAGSANQVVYKDSSNNAAGSNNLQFNGSNLSIGSISPWNAYQVLQIGVGSFASYSPSADTYAVSNAYYQSGWKYVSSSLPASAMQIANGGFNFYTAASGTADAAVSFVAAMTIGQSGDVSLQGNAAPSILLNGTTSTGARGLLFMHNGTQYARITQNPNSGEMKIFNGESGQTGYFITFSTDNAERMRITSGGNVGINETNPPYKLTVAGTGYFQGPASDTAGQAGVFINYGNAAGVVKRFLCLNGNGVTNAALGLNQIDANNGDLVISTLGSGTLTERIRLTYQGNFLLGTQTAVASCNFLASQSADTTAYIMVENTSNTASASAAVRYKSSDASINAFTGISSPTRDVYGGLGPNVTFFYTSSTAGMTLMVDQAGPITFCNGSPIAERMRLDSSGNLLVGRTTNAAGSKMAVSSSGITIYDTGYRQIYMNGQVLSFFNGSNEATLTQSGVWTNASDSRLKKNITNIKYGLNTVLITQPRSFERNDVEGNYIGFIAQELKEHIPEVVYGEKQLSVDYGSLVAVAFKAIQEQQALIELLTTRLTALENK